mmetsp:Transcript_27914/g.20909  ORF Transcript_27914/g.20909 Transcript_27914/m.20909 type:complete len:115 (+) Transcript_27914:930-1274(+)
MDAQIYTFDIKIGSKVIKLKIFWNENKQNAVRGFCKAYGLGPEKEEKLLEEVLDYFNSRKEALAMEEVSWSHPKIDATINEVEEQSSIEKKAGKEEDDEESFRQYRVTLQEGSL